MASAPDRPPLPPPHASPANGPLPAGLYDVSEQVLFDTCHPTRGLPPRVTVLKRHSEGRVLLSVPVPSFGFESTLTTRVETSPRGFQGSGMSHPKKCPGAQRTFEQRMFDVTPTSFRIRIDYEVADGWACPSPRPQPICRTSSIYTYTLAAAACESRCDGTVPNLRERDVPPGPTALSCACPM